MKIIFLAASLFFTTTIFSQKNPSADTGKIKTDDDFEKIFTKVQIEPEFTGGKSAWQKYLEQNLDTEVAVKHKAPYGKYSVIVGFIVSNDGSITNAIAENDPGYGTAQEAVRVITKGPKWKPASQNGKLVSYRARQMITFMVTKG